MEQAPVNVWYARSQGLDGEGGIRTHGTFRHTGFRDQLLQPLGHLSGDRVEVETLSDSFGCVKSGNAPGAGNPCTPRPLSVVLGVRRKRKLHSGYCFYMIDRLLLHTYVGYSMTIDAGEHHG